MESPLENQLRERALREFDADLIVEQGGHQGWIAEFRQYTMALVGPHVTLKGATGKTRDEALRTLQDLIDP